MQRYVLRRIREIPFRGYSNTTYAVWSNAVPGQTQEAETRLTSPSLPLSVIIMSSISRILAYAQVLTSETRRNRLAVMLTPHVIILSHQVIMNLLEESSLI